MRRRRGQKTPIHSMTGFIKDELFDSFLDLGLPSIENRRPLVHLVMLAEVCITF
jgi:hypothetical protein